MFMTLNFVYILCNVLPYFDPNIKEEKKKKTCYQRKILLISIYTFKQKLWKLQINLLKKLVHENTALHNSFRTNKIHM